MKAGVIGSISGTFDEITSFCEVKQQDGVEFARSLQVTGSEDTDSGHRIYTGEAAIQDIEETERVDIDPETGEIEVSDNGVLTGKYTEFLVVPGELMVVGSGKGTFAFRLLEELHPGVHVERIELDLNSYAEEYYQAEEVNPWQVGFYGNIGDAEKGVVYGDDVFSDDEIGEVLERSQLNQLGLEYEILGHDIKVTMAESGYVEVYNPSNFESSDYADYLVEEILSFTDSRKPIEA